MSQALAYVNLTEDTSPTGLVPVSDTPPSGLALEEQIAIRQARNISPAISHIFFRRYSGNRSAQIVAYIVDNADEIISREDIAKLHHKLWLSGITPLLYVGLKNQVDIFSCAAGDKRNRKVEQMAWTYSPVEKIKTIGVITAELEKARQYSAFRLADGTFWEDVRNSKLVNPSKSAHNALITKVKSVDKELDGANNPLARRLLLLTIFVKYLEDRDVFNCESVDGESWFSHYSKSADSFLALLNVGAVDAVRQVFSSLQKRFNGDIFTLPETDTNQLTPHILRELYRLVAPKFDANGQLYFWDLYSFENIPVEVLSHIYQHFAEEDKGAVFTPPFLVNLLLDQVMPIRTIKGDETVFDPTCGSGIFLVGAFKRLVLAWSARRNWKRPMPLDLIGILNKSIFGVEEQAEAAGVTAFSLALAVCDALRPDIIWNELRFDKLLGKNLLVGDFQERAPVLKERCTRDEGFDIIVGNPPFLSHLTPAMLAIVESRRDNIPDKQMAYFILKECLLSHLKQGGRLCMIQPSGLIYNNNSQQFLRPLLENYQFSAVLDFVSIRGLFADADTKIVAISALKNVPPVDHTIIHLTFRRTHMAKGRIQFELDFYDYHTVCQKDALIYHWPWRANLLGGGRLYHLAKRLSALSTLSDYSYKNGLNVGEGFVLGKKNASKKASWITGKRYLPSKALSAMGIDATQIRTINDVFFDTPYSEARFTPPLFLIREHETLPSFFWGEDRGYITYRAKIVGVYTDPAKRSSLLDFARTFEHNRANLISSLYLLGAQILVNKATVPMLDEILRLPWPGKEDWNLAQWEQDLLEDVREHMALFVRKGQNSPLFNRQATKSDFMNYQSTFMRLLKSVYPSLHFCGEGRADGLCFQAFCFSKANKIDWINDCDWLGHLRGTVFSQDGNAASLRTVRIVRLYELDTLVFIKPDLLRYWIKSTAIRDADMVLADIIRERNPHA